MKKLTFLKSLLLAIGLLAGNNFLQADPLLVENFDYPIGDKLTDHGWTAHSGVGSQPIDVTNGLSFTGYAGSGIGGAANLDNTGEDVNKTFAQQTSGTVYAAFLVQTQSTNSAGYFFHLGAQTIGTTFWSRVWVNATGDGLGISGSSAPGTYVSITAGTPTLVVVKYDIATKMSSLFVLNSYSATEPATPSQTFTEGTVGANVGSVALRQYNASQRIIVDGIRVATTWADAVAPASSNPVVATPEFSPAAGTYTSAQNVTISCATSGASIYYTTDGSDPDNTKTPYTGAISVTATTTIKARAYADGYDPSAIASATYIINTAPTITVTEVTIPEFSTNVGSSATNTIHVAGTNLTANIVLEISGTNADQFSVEPASLTPSEGTVAETDVTITYTPTSAGTHTATLTLSSEGATNVTLSLSGTAGLAAPVATAASNAGKTSFTANWEPVTGAEEYEISVYTKTLGTTTATELFISEYVEGSSNNKALEIFNGTGANVDLSQYSLKKQTNGAGEYTNERTLSGTLVNGDVYVIANTSASDAIKAKADLTETIITAFNGNDAIGLFKNGTQIDEVGVFNQPANWGIDVTLVRKSSVNSPKVPYDASEWDSYETDYIANLGTHTMDGFGTTLHPITGSPFTVSGTETSKVITGLSPATTYYYKVVAISGSVRSAASNEIAASTLSVGTPSMALKNIYVRDGKIYVNASAAGQRIEVYNTLGQRLVNVVSKEGENEISVPSKGIFMVKCGTEINKIILP